MIKRLTNIKLVTLLFLIITFQYTANSQCQVDLGGNYTICLGEEITLTASASGGDGNYSYSWGHSASLDSELTFVPTGDPNQDVFNTYTVFLTDNSGCSSSDDITIKVESTPTVSIVSTEHSCNSLGSIEFSFSNHPNRTQIEFSLNGGSNYENSVSDLSGSVSYNTNAGDYHCFVRWGNNECPVDLGIVTIVNDGAVSIDAGQDLRVCDGEIVTINPVITGGQAPYSYSWATSDNLESGLGLDIPVVGSSTNNIDKLYDITVNDAAGCSSVDRIEIDVRSTPTASLSAIDNSCLTQGGVEFSFPNHPNRTGIKFSVDGGSSYYSTVQDNSSSVFYALSAGNYHAFVRWGDNTCAIDMGAFLVGVDGSAVTIDAGNNFWVCEGSEVTLNPTVSGGTGPYSYSWQTSDGSESGSGLTLIALGSPSSNLNKDYDLTVTDALGCASTDRIRLDIRSRPTASLTTFDNTCFIDGGVEFSFPNHPNRSGIEFSVDGGNSFYSMLQDNSSSMFYSLLADDYHAFARWGDNNCLVDMGEFEVLSDGTSVDLDIGSDFWSCDGEEVTLNPNITGGQAPLLYSWQTADGSENGTGLTLTTTGSSLSNVNVDYDVTVTDNSGCVSTDRVRIEIRSNPTISTITTTEGCASDAEVNFEFPNHPNRSALEFSFDGGASYGSNVADNSSERSYNMAPGTYSTFVRWGNTQCPVDLGDVTLNEKNISLELGSDIFICNEELVTLSPTVTDGAEPYTYSWTDGTNSGSGLSFTPIGSDTQNTDLSFIFNLTDADGCTAVDDVEVTVRSRPSAETFSAATNCEGEAEVKFDFPDHPQYGGIAFSLDGGVSYEAPIADNSSTISYEMPEGVYSTYVMWHNGLCPTEIGVAEIVGGDTFYSGMNGNASDPIWTTPASSQFFSIDFCDDRNLVISSGNTVTLDETLLSKDLTIQNGGRIDLDGSSERMQIYGDFENLGDFICGDSEIQFSGDALQRIKGGTTKFHDVSLFNSNGVEAETSLEINGAFMPEIGVFNTNGNAFTLVSEDINGEITTGSIAEIKSGADFIGDIEIQRLVVSLEDGFRMIGIPIKNQTIGDFQGDFVTTGYVGSDWPDHWYTNIKYYEETEHVAGNLDAGYKNVLSTAELVDEEKGYWGYFPPSTSQNLLNAVGEFNKGDITFDLTYTDTGEPSNDGWHCIPNPYPSAIDIMSSDIVLNNVDRAIYIIDHELGGTWQGEYVVYNNGVSVNGASNIISSYQSFMVKANGPGASITFREPCKTNEQGMFFRNSEEERPLLRFAMNQDGYKYETVIAFHEEASPEFDRNYDAYKREVAEFGLGSVSGGDTLSINTIESYREDLNIPLYVHTPEAGEYSLTLDEIQNIADPLCLRIEDLITGEEHAISEGEEFIFFSEEGFQGERFILKSSVGANLEVNFPSCSDAGDANIQVVPSVSGTYGFTLFDSENQVVDQIEESASADFENLSPGVYNLELIDVYGVCSEMNYPVEILNPDMQMEPSLSFIRDNCRSGEGKLFISVEHESQLHVQVYSGSELVSEAFGNELVTVDGLEAGMYSVEIFDQCGSFELSADLSPLEELLVDFSIPSEVTLLDGLAVLELNSDSENSIQDSWLVDDVWLCSDSYCRAEFTLPGTYEITLISRTGQCEEIMTKTISVVDLTSDLDEFVDSDFSLSISEEFLSLSSPKESSVFNKLEFFDINGRLIDEWKFGDRQEINMSHTHYSSGVYILRLSLDGRTVFKNLFIK